jgi:cytochrome b561
MVFFNYINGRLLNLRFEIKKRKHVSLLNIFIIFSMVILLSLSIVSGLFSSSNPCSVCHKSHYETCTLDPNGSQSSLPAELFTQPSSIKMSVKITGDSNNFFYRISQLCVTLESIQGNVQIQNAKQTIYDLYPGDAPVFFWRVTGITSGSDSLRFTLSGLNPHHKISFTDSYSYNIMVSPGNGTGTQGSAIDVLTSTIIFHKSSESITLFVKQPVENIKIIPPQGISVQPEDVLRAKPGDEIQITFSTTSTTPIQGDIKISWVEKNNPGEMTLAIQYSPTPQQPVDYYSLAGRITAILLLGLLISSMVLGGASKHINAFINKKIKKRQKNEFHCLLSWVFFELALFHGAILLIGPYRNLIVNTNVILGYASAVGFFIVAVNGRYMNPIIRMIGAGSWRKIHKYASWTTLLLCLIHAILIGTEFALIRSMLGL